MRRDEVVEHVLGVVQLLHDQLLLHLTSSFVIPGPRRRLVEHDVSGGDDSASCRRVNG